MVVYWLTLQDYETEAEKFKSILDLEDGLVPQTYKRSRLESPAATVKAEVRHSMHGEAQFKLVLLTAMTNTSLLAQSSFSAGIQI